MVMDTRLSSRGPILTTAACLLVLFVTSVAHAQPRIATRPQEFEAGSDYQGLTSRITFEPSGTAWMATTQNLYRLLAGGSLQVVASAADKGTRLALAPDGSLYAWLVHDKVPRGLFIVQLVAMSQQPIAELRLPTYPHGFGALYLGSAGQLIVTVTPLDSPESIDGEFQYVFWDDRGQMLSTVKLDGRRKGVVDVGGNAILFLGESDAIAFSGKGRQLWKIDGSFRMAALAANGTVAFLNPSQKNAINSVHIYRNGAVTPITVSAPIHDLALAADGSDGAVAIDRGGVVFVAPSTCIRSQCQQRQLPALPIAGTYFISEMRFVDATTLAIATIERSGTAQPYTYPAGAVFVVTNSGRRVRDFPVALEQPSPGRPLIDVTNGVRFIATHTPHRALFVDLGP